MLLWLPAFLRKFGQHVNTCTIGLYCYTNSSDDSREVCDIADVVVWDRS